MNCEEALEAALKHDKIKLLLDSLGTSSVIAKCRKCDDFGIEGHSRGFLVSGSPLEIVLCSNRLAAELVEEVLTHELIHAFDFSKRRCDFFSCKGLAFTEIRAAREAECRDETSLFGFKNRCIKRKAIQSTKNLFPHDADRCVQDVFDYAINDRAPLE